jgi:hypothetical protein
MLISIQSAPKEVFIDYLLFPPIQAIKKLIKVHVTGATKNPAQRKTTLSARVQVFQAIRRPWYEYYPHELYASYHEGRPLVKVFFNEFLANWAPDFHPGRKCPSFPVIPGGAQ